MGNFQHLAANVLNKKCKVSMLFPLEKETGNFDTKNRNFEGNFNSNKRLTLQTASGVSFETSQETNVKLNGLNRETFNLKNDGKSFSLGETTHTILERFFNYAKQSDIQLLNDDRRWIKTICFGVSLRLLKKLLHQYTKYWIKAMENEATIHKKQNVGRYAANVFLRESLVAFKHNK